MVLYAPTYRDKLNTRTFAARRFDALELGRLARLLGPGHTLLVRGHNNNQRELDRVTGMAQVVDVTDYPDINELTLAADVAVLDYSSLRFDWAITGKPMVFFVPDLEDYFALRRPLFPYEGTAPGPWTQHHRGGRGRPARRRRPAVDGTPRTSSSSTSGSTRSTTGTPPTACSRRSSPTGTTA